MKPAQGGAPASCLDEFDPEALSLEEATAQILAAVQPVADADETPLPEACGRVLAADVQSSIDVPGHDNSAMDGYAVRGADLPREDGQEARLRVVGKAFAGTVWSAPPIKPGECARVMTGAPMPPGCDTVVVQERVALDGDAAVIGAGHRPGENVRAAGEDIPKGGLVLAAGRRLGAADIGLLASVGCAKIKTRRKPRAAFFSTGSELTPVGKPLAPGQIYDSNRHALRALLQQAGAEAQDLGVVGDDPAALRQTFDQASRADLIITSGGVSVGEADYTRAILEQHGEVRFHKLAIKPGRPLVFGRYGQAAYFGLPGNPVSAMVMFQIFVRPALQKIAGADPHPPLRLTAVCDTPLRKRPGRMEFQRGIVERRGDALHVRTTGAQGSGILTSMSRANCLIVLNAERDGVAAGAVVDVVLLGGLG